MVLNASLSQIYTNARIEYQKLSLASVTKWPSCETENCNCNCNIGHIGCFNIMWAQGCHLVSKSILICVTNSTRIGYGLAFHPSMSHILMHFNEFSLFLLRVTYVHSCRSTRTKRIQWCASQRALVSTTGVQAKQRRFNDVHHSIL